MGFVLCYMIRLRFHDHCFKRRHSKIARLLPQIDRDIVNNLSGKEEEENHLKSEKNSKILEERRQQMPSGRLGGHRH